LTARREEEAISASQNSRPGGGAHDDEPRCSQQMTPAELSAAGALARLADGEPLTGADEAALARFLDELLGPEDDDPARSCPPDDHACTCPPDDHGRSSPPDDDDARPGRAV
jgi:hypothetical protein